MCSIQFCNCLLSYIWFANIFILIFNRRWIRIRIYAYEYLPMKFFFEFWANSIWHEYDELISDIIYIKHILLWPYMLSTHWRYSNAVSFLGGLGGIFDGRPSTSHHSKMCLLKRICFFAAFFQCSGQTVSHIKIN